MIRINKGEQNTIALTLTEKVSIDSPNFLFEFINDATKEKKYCIAADISSYTYRYNKFIITETDSSPDPLNGEVTLSLESYWSYVIREQVSSTNLDPVLAGEIVEIGKVKVVGEEQVNTVYNPNEPQKTVYNG